MLKMENKTMAGKTCRTLVLFFDQQHANFFAVCDSLYGLEWKFDGANDPYRSAFVWT
jgi:hypothetical protein